jgi:acyl-CoA dehydrogenase
MRTFAETVLRPHAEEWEQAGWFSNDVFKQLAGRGWLGLKFPARYGGADDPVADAVLAEELARCGSGGVAAGIGAHSGIALPPIWRFGSEAQKQRYLVPGLRGDLIAALAVTEPDAGSDVASLRTRARRVAGGYRVSGAKTYITGGVRADIIVTAARTGQGTGHDGISLLIVERAPGVHSTRLAKLGWHASDTAQISFDEVFVPDCNLLGEEGRGFYQIMANFQWERLLMALAAVGAMQAVFERTLERVAARATPTHPAMRHRLAEVAVQIQAGRDITYAALRRFVAGLESTREVTIAKLATQRTACRVIDCCLQTHSDTGDPGDTEVERALRDARLGPIGGGTDEIMKEILGRSLGL